MNFRCIIGKSPQGWGCSAFLRATLTLFVMTAFAAADDCENAAQHLLPKKIQAEQFCASHGIGGVKALESIELTYVDSFLKGDWIEFNVNVTSAAKYSFTLSYASRKGGQVQISISADVPVPLALPKTGSSDEFAIATVQLSLAKGDYRLRVEGNSGSVNLDWISFIQDLTEERSPLESATYSLISELSRRSMDVQDRSRKSGANVQQWEYVASDNQQWQLIDHGGNDYEVRSVFSGHCLTLNVSNGNLVQQECSGAVSQRWAFELIAANFFVIKSRATSHVVSVQDEGLYDGANIVVIPFAQQKSQLWRVTSVR